MANPGYPPGMQPPMGGPPMGAPPMGAPPMQPPPPQAVRKGTSKAVPIVVSAGLAIGTFCGLLFGVGTGEEAVAEVSKGDNVKRDGKDKDMIMEGSKVTDPGTPKIDPPKTAQTASAGSATPAGSAAGSGETPAEGSGSATTTAAGSGAAPATGSGAAPATGSAAEPAVKMAKLTIEVTPEGAAKDAKISIDKKEIEGLMKEVELGKDGKKTVTLTVKANGYHSVNDQKVEVDGDMTVKIEMKKKAAAPTNNLPRPGGKKDGKSGKTGGGGLIDI